MTTKALKFLSPPGNTIDIITGGGIGVVANFTPCHFDLAAAGITIDIGAVLSGIEEFFTFGDDDADEDDDGDDIKVLVLIKR